MNRPAQYWIAPFILASALLLLALACVLFPPQPHQKPHEWHWIFQTSASAGDDFFQMENAWAQQVEALSNGKVRIELLPRGSVVQYNETLDAVAANIIQGHITDPSYFSGKDPAFAMLGNLVGAWSSPQEMLQFIDEAGYDLFNELVNPYGLQFIGASATGLEAFLSNKALHTVADLQGLKLRAPEGMVQEVFAAAGASPVNLPGSEVYSALEKGVIDAADYTVFATNHRLGMHRFAPYPIYPGFHSMPLVEISMNKTLWDSLPEDVQTLLRRSVSTLAVDMIASLQEKDLEALEAAKQNPAITVIDWSQEERAKFRAIAQSQWAHWSKRSPMADKVYRAVSDFLTRHNLIAK